MNFKITNTSAFQLFQLMRFGTLILIGIVFAKFSLATETIGEYEQFLFLAGGVSFFWLNGLIRGLLPISNHNRHNSEASIFNAFLLISFFTVLAIAFLAISGKTISKSALGEEHISYLNSLLLYLFFSVPANLVEYSFLLQKESKKIVNYGIVSFSAMFLMVAIPGVLGLGIQSILYGLVAISIFRYAYLWLLMIRSNEMKVSISFMKKHLGLSTPLILSALLSGSAQYVDGFIVTSRFDEATFAVFRFGARELPLVSLLANAFSNAMLPEFSNKKIVPSLLARIKTESNKLASYLFPLSALLIMLSHKIFPLVFNADFGDSASIFNIYLLLIISRLIFPQTILIGLAKTSLIAYASALELIVNVSLSLWFVSLWGIQGIAYATVIAFLFEKVLLVILAKRILNIPLTKYQNIFRHFGYSLLLLIVFIIVEFVIY